MRPRKRVLDGVDVGYPGLGMVTSSQKEERSVRRTRWKVEEGQTVGRVWTSFILSIVSTYDPLLLVSHHEQRKRYASSDASVLHAANIHDSRKGAGRPMPLISSAPKCPRPLRTHHPHPTCSRSCRPCRHL